MRTARLRGQDKLEDLRAGLRPTFRARALLFLPRGFSSNSNELYCL